MASRRSVAALAVLAGLVVGLGGGVLPVPHASAATLLSVAADRDAEVRQDSPGTSYGTRATMGVDGSPVRESVLRFPVAGVTGQQVTRVRLRMYQTDASRTGGTVFRVASADWPETVTWNTRPARDATALATYGAVAAGTWYEVDLPTSVVAGDGSVSLGLTSASSDGADWATRESGRAPTLLVDVSGEQPPPGPGPAVLSQVAAPSEGSSSPTYYPSNHRLAETSAGRLLTVFGRHSTGVQLAWRDPGAPGWSRSTSGVLTDGLLLSGTGTGDWAASIAVGRAATGQEFAVVVWSKANFGTVAPVSIRVLTSLDAPGGPQVGGEVRLTAPPRGAARADVGVEVAPDGTARVLLAWSERTGDSTYVLKSGWLDDPLAAVPTLVATTVHHQDSSTSRTASVTPTPLGARLATRADSGRLRVFGHDRSSPLGQWWSTGPGVVLPTGAYPSAAGLASGEVLVTAVRDLSQGIVTVQRFGGPGQAPVTVLELQGYAGPALAADPAGAWLVAVRASDGLVVSRSATPAGAWSAVDQVEVGADGGGGHTWPSVLGGARRDLVVRATGSSSTRSSVLALERPV